MLIIGLRKTIEEDKKKVEDMLKGKLNASARTALMLAIAQLDNALAALATIEASLRNKKD